LENQRDWAVSRSRSELRFRQRRLEELNRIAGGVVDNDLFSADAGDDVVPEMDASRTKLSDHRLEICDLNRKTIPTAGRLFRSVRHGLTASGVYARRAQHKTETSMRKHGERGRWVHLFMESEMPAVKVDRRVDVVHDVPYLNVCDSHC
jgi:hypothetical protein